MATLTNNSTIVGATNSFGSVWYPGNGDTILSNSPTYYYKNNGTYTIRLQVTSNYGCVDSAKQVVTVYDKPRTGFTVDSNTTCMNTSVNFTNNTTYSGGNNKILYLWNFGDNTVPVNDFKPSKAYGAFGSYSVTLYATDTIHYCTDSTVKIVQINQTPIAQFESPTGGCMNTPVQFTDKSSIGSLTVLYLWKFGDGGNDTASNPSHSYTASGTDSVTLKVTALSGCNSTQLKLISISPAPTVSLTLVPLSSNPLYSIKISATAGFASYKYILDDGTPVITAYGDTGLTHTYSNYSGYHKVTVIVTDNNGCTGTSTDSIYARAIGVAEAYSSQFGISVYPNPFTDGTTISYNLQNPAKVHIRVYDMIGRMVADIDHGTQSAGKHATVLDAEKFSVSTAAYLIRIQIDDAVITRQIIRQK